ncbi:hypothetical protein KWI08_02735 [Morganella morganii]|uniref:hypothetical protein n=1 Tax=Morganella morganii TaxID=582 RepID=UPI0021D29CBF|nr:hypothetical protein [Morganella morganii]MCU6272832.1 hypothetical protein [Morganella morganii]
MDHLKRNLLKHSLLFSALAALPGGLSAAPEQPFITDIRGRQINCRITPQRIYVADASLMFLYASLTGKQLTEKLTAIPAAFRHADGLSYQQYCRAFPALTALPHLAPLTGAQANTETIVDLHPDIIFVTTGTFSAMETGGISALLGITAPGIITIRIILMTTIFSPDALRVKTEKESQGRRTVIYSAKGQPNFMYQICRDDLPALHPAFRVNGRIIDAFFYASYPGSLHDDELIRERALMRGGAWYSQEFAGVSAFCLTHTALHRSATVGGRTAWIAPRG